MWIYLIAICTGLGGFTFGYDVGIVSGILVSTAFQKLVGITPQNHVRLEGTIATSLQFGIHR
jgi:hypothetical protein